jgi:uncharacterized phage-associated protein
MMITGVQLIEYLLKEYGPLPQKKLQKLAYLAEIEYIKKHGERLSDLSFKRYHYGPYSEDIRNIEDLEDNIIIAENHSNGYASKESRLLNSVGAEPIESVELSEEIDSFIARYVNSTGDELEKIADNTEPFLETENLNEPIDLDSFAWFYGIVNSDEFWKKAEMKDRENQEKGAYGKVLI